MDLAGYVTGLELSRRRIIERGDVVKVNVVMGGLWLRWLVVGIAVGLWLPGMGASAAVLEVSPQGAQPGDVLTLTVRPAAGERIEAVRMAAFDTPEVKFYRRIDGSERAFLGFPFDRKGGVYPLGAHVQVMAPGGESEQDLHAVLEARARVYPTQYVTMKPSTAETMGRKDALHEEKLVVQSKMQDSSPEALWKDPWLVPSPGESTSSYGRRRYVNGKWWGQHNGADIRAPLGAPVRAANSGRVVLSEYLPTLRGNCIVVDHGCNVFSVYMHLSKRLVSEGDRVEKGELIGRVGATGFVTGPHLHWEIRIGWEPVDPFRIVAKGLEF